MSHWWVFFFKECYFWSLFSQQREPGGLISLCVCWKQRPEANQKPVQGIKSGLLVAMATALPLWELRNGNEREEMLHGLGTVLSTPLRKGAYRSNLSDPAPFWLAHFRRGKLKQRAREGGTRIISSYALELCVNKIERKTGKDEFTQIKCDLEDSMKIWYSFRGQEQCGVSSEQTYEKSGRKEGKNGISECGQGRELK